MLPLRLVLRKSDARSSSPKYYSGAVNSEVRLREFLSAFITKYECGLPEHLAALAKSRLFEGSGADSRWAAIGLIRKKLVRQSTSIPAKLAGLPESNSE
jgi:hypothetical protein